MMFDITNSLLHLWGENVEKGWFCPPNLGQISTAYTLYLDFFSSALSDYV